MNAMVSLNALSVFVGSFIFSAVGLMTVKNGFFETAGLFVLFIITTMVFGMVILRTGGDKSSQRRDINTALRLALNV